MLAGTGFVEEKLLEIVSRLMALYAHIDQVVAEFQLKTGLRCATGCGKCCLTPDIQVTVLEMLPIANEMLRGGTADQWLERLSGTSGSGTCVLYKAHPAENVHGHCNYYKWRPVLCRLFGFAAVRGRNAEKSLAVCRHIRQNDPLCALAAMLIGEEAPAFLNYGLEVYNLDPVLGLNLIPINTALRQAIERIGLVRSYAYRESLRDKPAA